MTREKVKKMVRNENTSSSPGAGAAWSSETEREREIVYKVVTAWWGLRGL